MKRNTQRKAPPLGQHFLTAPAIAGAVAEAADVKRDDLVLEVGPGKGILTRELLARGARVVAIEKDPAMVAVLQGTFPEALSDGALTVIVGDARDILSSTNTAWPIRLPYKVVANIPYYITGELVRLFLTAQDQPQTIALLVQKEVAERIARSKKESLLSISVKVYGVPRFVRKVMAGSFSPPPSVDSAILAVSNISRHSFEDVSEEAFFEVVRAGFAQKRKMLAGNLKKLYAEEAVRAAFSKAGLPASIRAEDVTLSSWFSLAKALQETAGN